ncbi:hypothetical protein O0I10_007965 [Lichtheimia ornata]|uniref:LAG1-DNAbind-domain-containing protein n=1 Tax=Lichtheimia ornata TaxID=688661 RepID=A0AAD7UZK1_9FUNG|nr:uncharacterized protein O0I10_007965 [Lichtheimia ornata]KAJ8656397.1 hypothetical protein O0I10_007965 [Lichtheimia ornata]
MTSSINNTTTLIPDQPISRKRKQDFSMDTSKTSSSAAWSEFVYSSPSSPSSNNNNMTNATHMPPSSSTGGDMTLDSSSNFANFDINLDSIFASGTNGNFDHSFDFDQYNLESHLPLSGSASRRHSVAVGEMDYHSFDNLKQDFDIRRFDASLQQLLELPSSWSSNSTSEQSNDSYPPPAPHKRAMSLRLETSLPLQQQSTGSPDTPALFTPSFLDALNAEEDKDAPLLFPSGAISFTTPTPLNGDGGENNQQRPEDMLNMSSSPSNSSVDYLLQQHHQQAATTTATSSSIPISTSSTIAPSAISNNMWMMGGDHHHTPEKSSNRSTVAKRRVSKSRTSPPTSPSNTITSSMSSMSPSPPITPMQAHAFDHSNKKHHHPTILEEDETISEQQHNNNSWANSTDHPMRMSKSSLIAARMMQGVNTANILKPHVQQYLMSNDPAGSGERTIMILTSKVAQKSYGTEKRFLCPPPTTILSGSCWWASDRQEGPQGFYPGALAPPKLTIHISGEANSQSGVLEWYSANGNILDGTSSASAAASGDTTMCGKCVSKHLHINDADEKRKRVEVMVKMQLGNGLQLGTLASKGIKVISKPSKKRQSVKNMELCIHHGTTISLFNRIRSQTVSTKYLGVSNNVPVQGKGNSNANGKGNGTCFVARTGSWDPFVIWIVDTSRAPDVGQMPRKHHPTNPNYPPPPAIALQADTNQQPIAIHYNQAVVLQCVTTGLVSPVMVIRKVDKGSMVLGGNKLDDLSGTTGGECGDEALGDPVSQLHKIAFQIVQDPSIAHSNKAGYHRHQQHGIDRMSSEWKLPQSCQPITYLACLNDVVGMHKTTSARTLTSQQQPRAAVTGTPKSTASPLSWLEQQQQQMQSMTSNKFVVSEENNGKVIRKRRVSCDVVKPMSLPAKLQQSTAAAHRRRVNSLGDVSAVAGGGRRGSVADRRGSVDSTTQANTDGACWTEDVSDAAVWTIVGTDCATYTFWAAPPLGDINSPFLRTENGSAITPFPTITTNINTQQARSDNNTLTLAGEHLTRDLSVWFGDIKAPRTEYRSREALVCSIPDLNDLLSSPVITVDEHDGERKLPLLLVRGDGIVYRTGQFYLF